MPNDGSDERQDDVERQADALEAIARELRIQNAIQLDLAMTAREINGFIRGHEDPEAGLMGGERMKTNIRDRLTELRDEFETEYPAIDGYFPKR